jgi:3-phosphoshikimate 1-carboxyvinyltransferase
MRRGSLADPLPVRPRGALDARLRVPGSRSITNRALVAAGLAAGESRLVRAGASDDTEAMVEGLRALGVAVRAAGDDLVVCGVDGRLRAPARPLDARASGTTARFLTAVATLADGPVVVDGSPRMRERPIAELVAALRALGAGAEILGRDGCPPVRIAGGGLPGGRASIDARRSSQYVSGILLAAPYAARDVELAFEGGVLVSAAFVELTLEVMAAFGADARFAPARDGVRVRAGARYGARRYEVEPDAQSAVYGFAAAAIAGGRVVVEGIPARSRQTDLRFLDVLQSMGCRVKREPDAVEVLGPESRLRGVDVEMNAIPDAVLALAVVALFAEGATTIRGVAHLRVKESDRLAALEAELRRLGAGVAVGPDWLRIEPGPLRGAVIETYDDHRMAMSFALAGLRVPGVAIRDPGCVAKTWPGFFEALDAL